MSEKNTDQIIFMREQIQKLKTECDQLKAENTRLKMLLEQPSIEGNNAYITKPLILQPQIEHISKEFRAITNTSSTESKISLFRNLFRGREDVYAKRWESKDGKYGYSPACSNEWKKPVCLKPQSKCSDCSQRELLPLTDQVIYDHLAGKHTIGLYPLLSDETCWVLAADFDKQSWQEDAAAFLGTCGEMGISALLERSRSGNGGHVWIFFESPLPASLARKLGFAILTRTLDRRHQLGFESYDRFFPSQDNMPKGKFGNLIALPLQGIPRKNGNSLFLDDSFQPYTDQWALLSSLRKVLAKEVKVIVQEAERAGRVIGVNKSYTDSLEETPWTLPSSGRRIEAPLMGVLPIKVRIVQSNLIYLEKKCLPPALLARLMRIAAFQNPDFYKTQAMRLSTYGKPRVIDCAEKHPLYIGLPRGCLDEVQELLTEHKIKLEITDERFLGNKIDANFKGELNAMQQKAANSLLSYDNGVLSAPTAFGKTVLAAWLIAARKVNTLVLVHRRLLLDQWQAQLSNFIDMPDKLIGQIGGGKTKQTGIIDVGILQSINCKGEVKDLVAQYGQVIIDECHHLSAFSFEQVLRKVKARYVCGLTATPVRKDGHHPIIFMQCGPIRFQASAKADASARPFEHLLIPRHTNFILPQDYSSSNIQEIYSALINDEHRNDLIFDDLLLALEAGRSPLLLTERREHIDYFAQRLKGFARNVIVLRGGMGKRQREALAHQIASIPGHEERLIISTGRYIGEGFDDARLDTLFLVMPISWRGTLQQYAGRLHRLHDNKRIVQIYDYVDINLPVLMHMYEKRLKGYRAIGYKTKNKER